MIPFNVINFNPNSKVFESYDIMPYLVDVYNNTDEKPITFDEFKKFVNDESMYQFWSRCEYEIVLVDWPCQKTEEKWDVYKQISMNIDTITKIFIENVK